MLFNVGLNEVIKQWIVRHENIWITKTQVGDKIDNRACVDCLAFADDVVIVSETKEDTQKQFNNFKLNITNRIKYFL